jgi:hypothetical protein
MREESQIRDVLRHHTVSEGHVGAKKVHRRRSLRRLWTRQEEAMTKTKDPKETLAKLAKSTAKDYNLPTAEVSRIFMKYDVVQGGTKGKAAMTSALEECGALRAKLTIAALQKSGLL